MKNDILSSDARDASRRSFLKASLAATAISTVPFHIETSKPRARTPHVPTVSDLADGRFTHRMRDLYSNQTTHNELGYVQATKSVSGFTALAIPPFRARLARLTSWNPPFSSKAEPLTSAPTIFHI